MKIFSNSRKTVIVCLAAFLLISAIAFSPDYFEVSKNLDIFNSVYRELNASYVDGTKPTQLMKTGIDAMLNSLDPFTVYYSENDIEDYRFMTTGEYGGIGATVMDVDGKITITEPYEGFSAFKAGLRAGDQIAGVNNINAVGKKTNDISVLLKGTPGSSLTLKIIKAGEKNSISVPIIREEIKTKAVPYFGMLSGTETGYIKLVSFTENCSGAVKDAFTELKSKGCKNLILDLRGNLGGLLLEAVNIVNFFIPKGQEIVFTRGKTVEWNTRYLTVNNPIDIQIPIVVLVDENSASASEIVSGSLQDLDRAVIVGKRTYGKGLVQQTKPLVYNTQVKITVAKYYIPSGRCVQALDYSNRDEEGRVTKVPDSLITAFKTKGGRIVYDGAGVMPDVKTDDDRTSEVMLNMFSQFHFFNFATEYVLKHKEIGDMKSFKLSEEEFSDFTKYLKSKSFVYKTNQENDLEDFKKMAIEEKKFTGIEKEFESLKSRILSNKLEDLQKNKNEIKKFLEEEIVSRYYFQKGRIEFSLQHDNDVETGIGLLKQQSKMNDILIQVDKPNKPFNINKKF